MFEIDSGITASSDALNSSAELACTMQQKQLDLSAPVRVSFDFFTFCHFIYGVIVR